MALGDEFVYLEKGIIEIIIFWFFVFLSSFLIWNVWLIELNLIPEISLILVGL